MHTALVKVDPVEAAAIVRKYKEHRAWATPVDTEIERLARMIAKGKVIIRALESIRTGGVDEMGRPKLAIARADAKRCYLDIRSDGSGIMHIENNRNGWLPARMAASRRFDFDAGTFPVPATRSRGQRNEAIVPHIPPDIRPKRGLQNYHILFEAEWTRTYPIDPMLLRRVGNSGDTWIVVEAWALTDIERAVLSAHMGTQQ